jgi:putative DNA primase/helicase
VFIGTINPGEAGYLTDSTGNRRYWPVPVVKADLDLLEDRRDQIWAEAYRAFLADEPWWLTPEEETLAAAQVADREEYDVWDEILADKLNSAGVRSTSIAAALQAIGVPNERMDRKARDRVAGSLRRIGFASKFAKERDENGRRSSIRIFYREDG